MTQLQLPLNAPDDAILNDLARYIADYIEHESNENEHCEIDRYMIQNAIEAYLGGAR
jgi:hypothetical protein